MEAWFLSPSGDSVAVVTVADCESLGIDANDLEVLDYIPLLSNVQLRGHGSKAPKSLPQASRQIASFQIGEDFNPEKQPMEVQLRRLGILSSVNPDDEIARCLSCILAARSHLARLLREEEKLTPLQRKQLAALRLALRF